LGTCRTCNIGNGIKIETPEGHEVIYGHLSNTFVKEGQYVHIGQIIGETGNSGNSTGFHLHLGEKINGHFVDPSHYVDILQQLAHNLLDVSWATIQCIVHMF
jgi:murein DD-endopeptidase MepM/ murein hydrolase activator NlpD